MQSNIPDTIQTRFAPWSDIDCWVMCNSDKQPITVHSGVYLIPKNDTDITPKHYSMGSLLRWKREPQDHIASLSRIQKTIDMFPPGLYGFGAMLGRGNALCCYDFDHCIDADGSIPAKVEDFLKTISTFVEISSSGTGLHAFVAVDGHTEEYDFKDDFCAGKCYVSRFLKLTGTVFRNYDLPIRFIDETDFYAVKKRIGDTDQPDHNRTVAPFTGDVSDWGKILSEAGIRYEVIPGYKETERKHGDVLRTAIWTAKVQCPNAYNHTDFFKRKNEFNPDVAILTLWNDNSTSVKCNHNHCKWFLKPNLLLKLWMQIKENRANIGRRLLRSAGVRL